MNTLCNLFLFFSIVKDGLGQILIVLGIATLSVLFHCNLHSIEDPQRIRQPSIFLKNKFTYTVFLGLLICAMCVFLQFDDGKNHLVTHVQIVLYIFSLCILLPKYYIAQNENLELYVSVYHQIPAPVLPWQIPENFEPNSVQLNVINHI